MFGKSDVLFASKAEPRDIRVGSEDTIRLSLRACYLLWWVLTADVDVVDVRLVWGRIVLPHRDGVVLVFCRSAWIGWEIRL